MTTIVFIYQKGSDFKVLDVDTAKKAHGDLLLDKWKHTSTVDICMWMEKLLNQPTHRNMILEIEYLTK